MKKIGLFYGGTTAKTAVVALKIQEAFAETWKQGMNGDLSVC